jgi:hypothetical protein
MNDKSSGFLAPLNFDVTTTIFKTLIELAPHGVKPLLTAENLSFFKPHETVPGTPIQANVLFSA